MCYGAVCGNGPEIIITLSIIVGATVVGLFIFKSLRKSVTKSNSKPFR